MDVSRSSGFQSPQVESKILLLKRTLLKRTLKFSHKLGPRLPTWALQQVGSYLGYSGRGANAFGKAAHVASGRTNVPSPWRPHRCCPRLPDSKGFGRCRFRGSLTQLQHLLSYASRFALPLTRKVGFRLAGWPLPGGRRTLWIAAKGFRSHGHPPFLSS
jgi:hypothetical protein